MTFLAISPVAAQQMDESTLRAQMIQAQGKPPDQYREEIIVASSMTGTFLRREYHRGIDYRIVSGSGSSQRQNGRIEGREWDQDANGITTIHASASGNERTDPQRVTVIRVNQPVPAWRLASLDVHGFGSTEYIDPATYHLVRTEIATSTGTVTTVYDDFKTVNGYTSSNHWVTDDTSNGAHSDASVVTFQNMPISDADLAIPPSRDFITFPAGGTPVVLPTIFNPPHIVIRTTIGERTMNFLLDTSSPGVTIDANVAQQLGLINSTQTLLVNARRLGVQVVVPEIRVGDLTMHNVAVTLGGVAANQQIDSQSVGSLGYDFIRSAALTIDFSKRRVTAIPANHFTAPVMTTDSDILPVRVVDHQPVISVTLDNSVAEHMVLDTGAGADMIVFDSFSRRYPEIFATNAATAEDPVLYSGAKEPNAKGFRMEEVHVGRYEFKAFDVINVAALKNYPPDTDGLIGPGMLEHFTATLDLVGGKLYLVHSPGQ